MRKSPDLPPPFTFFSDILNHPDVQADVAKAELTVEMLNRSSGRLSPKELSTIADMTFEPIRDAPKGRSPVTAYMGTLAKIAIILSRTVGRPFYGDIPRDELTPLQVKDELVIIARRLEPADATQVLDALIDRQHTLEPVAFEHRLARMIVDQARPQRLFGNDLRNRALQAADAARGNVCNSLTDVFSDQQDIMPLIDRMFNQ